MLVPRPITSIVSLLKFIPPHRRQFPSETYISKYKQKADALASPTNTIHFHLAYCSPSFYSFFYCSGLHISSARSSPRARYFYHDLSRATFSLCCRRRLPIHLLPPNYGPSAIGAEGPALIPVCIYIYMSNSLVASRVVLVSSEHERVSTSSSSSTILSAAQFLKTVNEKWVC